MEHISLPVLRMVEAKNVDANTIISPVEPVLTPVSPEGRTKLEDGSLFNMDRPSGTVQFQTTSFSQPAYLPTAGQNNTFLHPQFSQDMNYNHNNLYPNAAFSVHPMDQPRAFPPLDPNDMGSMVPARRYGSMDSNFAQVKVEQSPAFNTMSMNFGQAMPNHNYIVHQPPEFSMPQEFSAATAVSGYPSTNLLINDAAADFGFNPATGASGQAFQQVPMSRAQGSASSYGHSPHNTPYYGQ